APRSGATHNTLSVPAGRACDSHGMTAASAVLPDGRRLAYSEQGDPAGRPLLLLHGTPGSRLQRHPDGELARRAGVRLVTVDRPGFGLSDPAPGRSLLDWADDVTVLAAELGLERFSVAGVSGGGAFALACAQRLPARIERVLLVSCPAPPAPGSRTGLRPAQRLQFLLAARAPWLLRLVFASHFRAARNLTPAAVRSRLQQELPTAEKQCLGLPGFTEMLLADSLEAGRQGAAATTLE